MQTTLRTPRTCENVRATPEELTTPQQTLSVENLQPLTTDHSSPLRYSYRLRGGGKFSKSLADSAARTAAKGRRLADLQESGMLPIDAPLSSVSASSSSSSSSSAPGFKEPVVDTDNHASDEESEPTSRGNTWEERLTSKSRASLKRALAYVEKRDLELTAENGLQVALRFNCQFDGTNLGVITHKDGDKCFRPGRINLPEFRLSQFFTMTEVEVPTFIDGTKTTVDGLVYAPKDDIDRSNSVLVAAVKAANKYIDTHGLQSRRMAPTLELWQDYSDGKGYSSSTGGIQMRDYLACERLNELFADRAITTESTRPWYHHLLLAYANDGDLHAAAAMINSLAHALHGNINRVVRVARFANSGNQTITDVRNGWYYAHVTVSPPVASIAWRFALLSAAAPGIEFHAGKVPVTRSGFVLIDDNSVFLSVTAVPAVPDAAVVLPLLNGQEVFCVVELTPITHAPTEAQLRSVSLHGLQGGGMDMLNDSFARGGTTNSPHVKSIPPPQWMKKLRPTEPPPSPPPTTGSACPATGVAPSVSRPCAATASPPRASPFDPDDGLLGDDAPVFDEVADAVPQVPPTDGKTFHRSPFAQLVHELHTWGKTARPVLLDFTAVNRFATLSPKFGLSDADVDALAQAKADYLSAKEIVSRAAELSPPRKLKSKGPKTNAAKSLADAIFGNHADGDAPAEATLDKRQSYVDRMKKAIAAAKPSEVLQGLRDSAYENGPIQHAAIKKVTRWLKKSTFNLKKDGQNWRVQDSAPTADAYLFEHAPEPILEALKIKASVISLVSGANQDSSYLDAQAESLNARMHALVGNGTQINVPGVVTRLTRAAAGARNPIVHTVASLALPLAQAADEAIDDVPFAAAANRLLGEIQVPPALKTLATHAMRAIGSSVFKHDQTPGPFGPAWAHIAASPTPSGFQRAAIEAHRIAAKVPLLGHFIAPIGKAVDLFSDVVHSISGGHSTSLRHGIAIPPTWAESEYTNYSPAQDDGLVGGTRFRYRLRGGGRGFGDLTGSDVIETPIFSIPAEGRPRLQPIPAMLDRAYAISSGTQTVLRQQADVAVINYVTHDQTEDDRFQVNSYISAHGAVCITNRFDDHTGPVHAMPAHRPLYFSNNITNTNRFPLYCSDDTETVLLATTQDANAFGVAMAPRDLFFGISSYLLQRLWAAAGLNPTEKTASAGALMHKMHEILFTAVGIGRGGYRHSLTDQYGYVTTRSEQCDDLDHVFAGEDYIFSTFDGMEGAPTDGTGFVISAKISTASEFHAPAFDEVDAAGLAPLQRELTVAQAIATDEVSKVYIDDSDDDAVIWLKIALVWSSFLVPHSQAGRAYHGRSRVDGHETNNGHSQYAATSCSISDDAPLRVLLITNRNSFTAAGIEINLGATFDAQEIVVEGYDLYSYAEISAAASRLMVQIGISPELFHSYTYASVAHVLFSAAPDPTAPALVDSNANAGSPAQIKPATSIASPIFDDFTRSVDGETLRHGSPINVAHLPPGARYQFGDGAEQPGNTIKLNRPSMKSPWFTFATMPIFTASPKTPEPYVPEHAPDYWRKHLLVASEAALTFTRAYALVDCGASEKWKAFEDGEVVGMLNAQASRAAANGYSFATVLSYYYQTSGSMVHDANAAFAGVSVSPIPSVYAALAGLDVNLLDALRAPNLDRTSLSPALTKDYTPAPAVADIDVLPYPNDTAASTIGLDSDRTFLNQTFSLLQHIAHTDFVDGEVPSLVYYPRFQAGIPDEIVCPSYACHNVFSALILGDRVPSAVPYVSHIAHIPRTLQAPSATGVLTLGVTTGTLLGVLKYPASRYERAWPNHVVFQGPTWRPMLEWDQNESSTARVRSDANSILAQLAQKSYASGHSLLFAHKPGSAVLPNETAGTEQDRLNEAEKRALAATGHLDYARLLNSDQITVLRLAFDTDWPNRLATAIRVGVWFTPEERRNYLLGLDGDFVSPFYSKPSVLRRAAKTMLANAYQVFDQQTDTKLGPEQSAMPAYTKLQRIKPEWAAKFAHAHGAPVWLDDFLADVHVPFATGIFLAYALFPGARHVVDLLRPVSNLKPTTEALAAYFKAITVMVNKLGSAAVAYDGPAADLEDMSVLVGYTPILEHYDLNVVDAATAAFTETKRPEWFYRAFERVNSKFVHLTARQTKIDTSVTLQAYAREPQRFLTSGAFSEKDLDGQRLKKNASPLVTTHGEQLDEFSASVLTASYILKINEKGKPRFIAATSKPSHAVFRLFKDRTRFLEKAQRAGTAGTATTQLAGTFRKIVSYLRPGWAGAPMDYPAFDTQQNIRFASIVWNNIASAYKQRDPLAYQYARTAGSVFTNKYVKFPNITPEQKSQLNLDWLDPGEAAEVFRKARVPHTSVPIAHIRHGMLSGQSSTTMENTINGIGYWDAVTSVLKSCVPSAQLKVTSNVQAGDDTDVYVGCAATFHALYRVLASVFTMRDRDYTVVPGGSTFLKRDINTEGYDGYPNRALLPLYQRDPLSPLSTSPQQDISELNALYSLLKRRGADHAPLRQLYYHKVASIFKSYGIQHDTSAKHLLPQLGGLGVLPIDTTRTVPKRHRIPPLMPATPHTSPALDLAAASWQKRLEPSLPLSAYHQLLTERANSGVGNGVTDDERTEYRERWRSYSPPTLQINARPKQKLITKLLEALEPLDRLDPNIADVPPPKQVNPEAFQVAKVAFGPRKAYEWAMARYALPNTYRSFPHYSLASAVFTSTITPGTGNEITPLAAGYFSSALTAAVYACRYSFKRMSYDASLASIHASVAELLAGPRALAVLGRFRD